jgi:hypothetical protein
MKLKITSTHEIAFDHFQINAEHKEISVVLNFSSKEAFEHFASAKGIDIELRPLSRRKLEETEQVVVVKEKTVKKLKLPVEKPKTEETKPVVETTGEASNTPPKVVHE